MSAVVPSLPAVLRPILESVRASNARRRRRVGVPAVAPVPKRRVAFVEALRARGVQVIAEAKRSSPSAGALLGEEDTVERVRRYAAGGAAAVSILTEPTRFAGRRAHLVRSRAVGVPLLRKDFVLDPAMIDESAAMGASAVLLIARCLAPDELVACTARARDLGLASLVEIHREEELEAALTAEPDCIGVNARDLDTLEVDLARGLALLERVPSTVVRVAESGVAQPADVARAGRSGADAVLIGTAFARCADPRAAVAACVRAGAGARAPVRLLEGLDLARSVKVCGLTRVEDVRAAHAAGADLFGVIAEPTRSVRAVDTERARELLRAAPVGRGVLVTTEDDPRAVLERALACGADLVQLCGPQSAAVWERFPLPLLRALAVDAPEEEVRRFAAIAAGFVLEPSGSVGGSGRSADAGSAQRLAARRPALLAGGLDANAVTAQLAAVGVPVGADASSRLESAPGIKDPDRVARFVRAARRAIEEVTPCS